MIDDWELQDLVMCPSHGTIVASPTTTGTVVVQAHSPHIQTGMWNEVEFRRDGNDIFLWIEWVMFNGNTPGGFGCCAFLRCAQAARRLGLARIDLLAAGGNSSKGRSWNPGFIGYYTWPRFGFDCLLERNMLQKVQQVPAIANCRTVLDVMAIDAQWWKSNGDGLEMTFDLAQNSLSWQTLSTYMRSKALAV